MERAGPPRKVERREHASKLNHERQLAVPGCNAASHARGRRARDDRLVERVGEPVLVLGARMLVCAASRDRVRCSPKEKKFAIKTDFDGCLESQPNVRASAAAAC